MLKLATVRADGFRLFINFLKKRLSPSKFLCLRRDADKSTNDNRYALPHAAIVCFLSLSLRIFLVVMGFLNEGAAESREIRINEDWDFR